MHGLLKCNINAGVRSGRVTQRCHNSPDGKRGYRVWMTSRTGSARRIWGILKKVSWVEFCLGRRQLAVACSPKPGQWPCDGCHTYWGCRWKSQNKKNVYLSPCVKEPLNSKVIKSFVPELRSHECFFVFRDSYVLCIYVMNILMYVSRSRIWLW